MYLVLYSNYFQITAFVVDGDKKQIVKKFQEGTGNYGSTPKEAIVNYSKAIWYAREKYDVKKVVLFSASYSKVDHEDRKEFKKQIRAMVDSSIYVSFNSDGVLPLCGTLEPTVAITLGSGTSVSHNLDGRIKLLHGNRHLTVSRKQGDAVARRIIYDVVTGGSPTAKKKLHEIYSVGSDDELMKKANNVLDDRFVSSGFNDMIDAKELDAFVKVEFVKEGKELMSPEVIEAFKRTKNIILNGHAATHPSVRDVIANHVSMRRVNVVEFDFNQGIINSVEHPSIKRPYQKT